MNDDPTKVDIKALSDVLNKTNVSSELISINYPHVLANVGTYGSSSRDSSLTNYTLAETTVKDAPSKSTPGFTYSDAIQEGYKQGIQAAVAWLLAYDKTIPLARLQPSLSFITNKMEEELSATKQICQECDPPGSGKECRGGTCHRCKGLGTV